MLSEYNGEFLRMVIGVASAVALGAYCLWAFDPATPPPAWRAATILPFTLALLRYGLLVHPAGAARRRRSCSLTASSNSPGWVLVTFMPGL